MRWLRRNFSLAMLATMLCLPMALQACPLCKDAISSPGSGEGDEEINNSPLAYNHSIYLMAGMPYLLLGFFGFIIYRGCKRNDDHRRDEGT